MHAFAGNEYMGPAETKSLTPQPSQPAFQTIIFMSKCSLCAGLDGPAPNGAASRRLKRTSQPTPPGMIDTHSHSSCIITCTIEHTRSQSVWADNYIRGWAEPSSACVGAMGWRQGQRQDRWPRDRDTGIHSYHTCPCTLSTSRAGATRQAQERRQITDRSRGSQYFTVLLQPA